MQKEFKKKCSLLRASSAENLIVSRSLHGMAHSIGEFLSAAHMCGRSRSLTMNRIQWRD
jgi:hypothetical protein